MTIEVRRAKQDDEAAIMAFIKEAYDGLAFYKGPERWHWQFVDNPFLPLNGDGPPVWIALHDTRIVGQIAVQAGHIKIDNELHRGGWIVDVMILPEYRGRGLGHRLHDAVAQEVPLLLTLTMAPATRRIAERSGAVTLGPTRQYSRWTRIRPADIERYLMARTFNWPWISYLTKISCRIFAVHVIGATLLRPWLALRAARTPRWPENITIEQVSRFDSEVDSLWRSASSGYPAICPRDSRFLNWRFVNCPQLTYDLFVARRNGGVIGYVVLRRTIPQELRQGIIADLFAARGDWAAWESLIFFAIKHFGQDVASIECATSMIEIDKILRAAGFFPTRTLAPTIVATDVALRSSIQQRSSDWHFTKGDHDWDQIHLT